MEISDREFENVIQQTGRGDLSVLENFLDSGGDPDRRRPKSHHETLLIRAAYYGQLQCVKMLLEYGATVSLGEADTKLSDVPPEDYEYTGMTALAWAKAKEHSAIAELLEMHSAAPESRSNTAVVGSPVSSSSERGQSPGSADASKSPLSAFEPRAPIASSSAHSPFPKAERLVEEGHISSSHYGMSPAVISQPSELLRASYKLNANKGTTSKASNKCCNYPSVH